MTPSLPTTRTCDLNAATCPPDHRHTAAAGSVRLRLGTGAVSHLSLVVVTGGHREAQEQDGGWHREWKPGGALKTPKAIAPGSSM